MGDCTTPVGRLVYGSPAKRFQKKNNAGQPIINQHTGQPVTEISFGIAIPKAGEQHWNQTQWGAVIWQAALDGWGNGEYQRPDFSWKITDGDSNIPNKKGNKPCEKEGYPGHWVLSFTTQWDLKLYDYIHSQGGEIFEEGVIKTGHYIQVYFNSEPNNKNNPTVQSPGVYLNPVYVAHSAYGPEIVSVSGPDVSSVGFGNAQLPAGATTTPQSNGGFNPAAPQQQQGTGVVQHAYAGNDSPPNGQPVVANTAQQVNPAQQGGYQQQTNHAQGASSVAQGVGNQQPMGNPAQNAQQNPAVQSAAQQTNHAQGASSVAQGVGNPNHAFVNGAPQQ